MKKVFISYAHEDESYKDNLKKHLKSLERMRKIEIWDDRGINAGDEWREEIMGALKTSEIILLLISPDFIASDFCFETELMMALKRHEEKTARVIPIIIRNCEWTGFEFSKLQALPKNAKPVVEWGNADEAYLFIAKQIKAVV